MGFRSGLGSGLGTGCGCLLFVVLLIGGGIAFVGFGLNKAAKHSQDLSQFQDPSRIEKTPKNVEHAEKQQLPKTNYNPDAAANAENCPLKIMRAIIGHDIIGQPILTLEVKARQNIEAYEIEADAFDKFNEPVKSWGFSGHEHGAMCQDRIPAGKNNSSSWTMSGAEGVGLFKCKVLRVKLADGTVWKAEGGADVTFEAHLAGQALPVTPAESPIPEQTPVKPARTHPLAPPEPALKYRTWHDNNGHALEAAFIQHKSANVTLRKRDGKEVSLSIYKLSDEDREWIRQQEK